jgi:hypothetical protein
MHEEKAMASYEVETNIRLAAREAVSIEDVGGATLRVRRGVVWVTQERDPHDIVLRAGDNWVVERDGRTVVEAQERSSLAVVGRALPGHATRLARRSLLSRTRQWLAWVTSLSPRHPLPYV